MGIFTEDDQKDTWRDYLKLLKLCWVTYKTFKKDASEFCYCHMAVKEQCDHCTQRGKHAAQLEELLDNIPKC